MEALPEVVMGVVSGRKSCPIMQDRLLVDDSTRVRQGSAFDQK